MKTPLSRKAFRAWLQNWQPDDIVGYRNDSTSCPLANFLSDTTHECWWFDGDTYGISSRVTFMSPKWAENYVDKVDYVSGIITYKPITAKEALILFKEV